MKTPTFWPRVLMIAGLAGMLIGAIDPLEGSLIILPGRPGRIRSVPWQEATSNTPLLVFCDDCRRHCGDVCVELVRRYRG